MSLLSYGNLTGITLDLSAEPNRRPPAAVYSSLVPTASHGLPTVGTFERAWRRREELLRWHGSTQDKATLPLAFCVPLFPGGDARLEYRSASC